MIPLVDDERWAVRVPSRVALAVGISAACVASVAALDPLLARPYYFPAFAGIVLSAVLAGGSYGVLTVLLFSIGFVYLYVQPRGTLVVRYPYDAAAMAGYIATGVFVAVVSGSIRGLYARLRAEHRLLEKTVAQREDLLRALTHDVRSPLNTIALNAALLARNSGEGAEAVARRAALVHRSVAAIDSMLRDLVSVVALESGQIVLERTRVELRPIIEHLRDALPVGLGSERLELGVPGDLPALDADRDRLERVLANLISNALKYSEGPVTVGAEARASTVVVSVRDRGPGIGARDLPHVFDKYYRAAAAREREGLGLGLYICRLLVEAHGGRIWAESSPDGSTFSVAIPALPAAAAPVRQPQRPAGPSPRAHPRSASSGRHP